jgi:antitoxin HicB
MDILKKPYRRVLIPDEVGGYSAQIIEFHGCFAEGETVEEAYRNLEKAAQSWILACEEAGQPIPEPLAERQGSGRIALRLPKSLHHRAMVLAETEAISLNQFLLNAIAEFVGVRENNSAKPLQVIIYPDSFVSALPMTSLTEGIFNRADNNPREKVLGLPDMLFPTLRTGLKEVPYNA